MPAFTRSIAIARRPEQVFAVLDDVEGAPRWLPAVRRVEVLTPGMPMGVGFRWRETRRAFGVFRVRMELFVVRHEPPSAWGLAFNDGKVRAAATFELRPQGGGTLVTFTEEVEDLLGKPRRAERMLAMMEREDGDLLDRLKARVEATTEPPAPAPAAPPRPAPPAAAPPPAKGARKAVAQPKPARKAAAKAPARKAAKKAAPAKKR